MIDMRSLRYCVPFLLLFANGAMALEPQRVMCEAYFSSVFNSNSVVSSGLLQNEDKAIQCLVDALKLLSQKVVSPRIDESNRSALNRVAGALLRITDLGRMTAINKIRSMDDISVASVLSFGARNEYRETRLNCTALLSNIIDNSTVCVPMDHLADPELLKDEWGVSGRANLIAVVSVVAPWAYKSNYENMQKLVKFLDTQLSDEKDVSKTIGIVQNLRARLLYQDTLSSPNKDKDPTDLMAECRNRGVIWAVTPQYKLIY